MKVKYEGEETKLPDFLIVGVSKSGTSSLYNYLKQNSGIYMSKHKEPKFFAFKNRSFPGSTDKVYLNFKNYKKLFENASSNQIIGEATVSYLYFYNRVINNLKEIYGKDNYKSIKIIILLREPVSRAYSHYKYHKRLLKLRKSFSFSDAIEAEMRDEKNERDFFYNYIDFSRYYKQVKAYLNNFDNVKILFFEDFKKDNKAVVKEITDFLNVEYEETNFRVYNKGGDYKEGLNFLKPFYRWFLKKDNFLRKVTRKLVPMRIRSFLDRKIRNIFIERSYEKIDKEFKKKIREKYFAEDIKKLKELLPDKKEKIDRWLEE